jgi:hypothetical protein
MEKKTAKTRKTKKQNQKNKTKKNYGKLKEKFTAKQKQEIVDILNPISDEEVESSWTKLRELKCKGAIAASSGIITGNDVVDKFTMIERLHTKGHTGIDFYTFWYNRAYFKKIGYVKNMLNYYKNIGRNIAEVRIWKYIFNLYFSSIL